MEDENPRDPADFPDVAGVYTYGGTFPTTHARLGELQPGANDFTGFTHPETLQALGFAVTAGLLVKVP
jgi:hypothetical protein